MDKRTLTEQFFIIDFIPEILPLDHKVLTKEAIITRSLGKNKSKEEWDYKHEYYEVTHHPHITWVKDYIRDHYKEKYGKTLFEIDQSYIVQLNKEGLKKHNYMHEYEYTKTPDISCLYCLATGRKTSYIIFEYKGGRIRNGKWKIPVEERKLVLFSSQMDHYITKNENKDAIINLSFQYQLM